MRDGRLWRLVLAFAAVAAATTTVHAANPSGDRSPLRLFLRPVVPRVRSHTPVTLEARLSWDRPELLEGRLELKFFVDQTLVGRSVSDELALTSGGHKFRFTMPPLNVPRDESVVTAYPTFVGEDQFFELEPQDLSLPAFWRRSLVIGVCSPPERASSPEQIALLGSLAIEQFNPDLDTRVGLSSFSARVAPEEFPSRTVQYCRFDLLVLESDGFVALRGSQLDAIAGWVEAGGSVCVLIDRRLTKRHVGFLNRLAGADPTQPEFFLDAKQQLAGGVAPGRKKFQTFRAGLGRTIVVSGRLDEQRDLDSPDWRRATAFLWKLRADQADRVAKTGSWEFTYHLNPEEYALTGHPTPFRPRPLRFGRLLLSTLLPPKVQGLPFYTVIAILTLFLLAIAPGDYFLLGLLKRRKYTWLLFPTVSLAFTYFTVQLAKSHMADTDHQASLVVCDLADDGHIARTSRYELLFPATQKMVAVQFRDTLHTTMDLEILRRTRHGARVVVKMLDAAAEREPPLYQGHMPLTFTVSERLRQWSPNLSRLTTFTSDVMPPDFAWHEIDLRSLQSPQGRGKLRDRIVRSEPSARVVLLCGRHIYDLGSTTATAVRDKHRSSSKDTLTDALLKLIREASVPSEGLFSIFSQISPTGAGNFEDLGLLDWSDPDQWLLLVLTRKGNDWFVFRKLLIGPGSRTGVWPDPEKKVAD